MEDNSYSQNIYVRVIKDDDSNNEEEIIVYEVKDAIKKQLTRHSDMMEIYNKPEEERVYKDGFLAYKNEFISNTVIKPTTIMDLVDHYGVKPDVANGILLKWAIAHSSLSVVIYLLSTHKDKMMKYIDIAVNDSVSNSITISPNIFDYFINYCGYNIHKNDDQLFAMCAMGKKYSMSRYLLEKGANIPICVYIAYSTNNKKYKIMWDLIKEYRHRVITGGED